MLNKLNYFILTAFLFISCIPTKSDQTLQIKNEQLVVIWKKQPEELSTVDTLKYDVILVYPLGTEAKIEIINLSEFSLIDKNKNNLAPPHPDKLKSKFNFTFEPPEPGKFQLPVFSFSLDKNASQITSLESPIESITILSNNPDKEFSSDHLGDLKARPSKWLLVSLLFLLIPFAPKKKRSASKNLVAISSEDIENCPLEFHAIEDLLVNIINQELIEKIIDLKNARIKLCDSSQYHQKLDNFINTYQKARYSTGGKNPAELINELNKIYRGRNE